MLRGGLIVAMTVILMAWQVRRWPPPFQRSKAMCRRTCSSRRQKSCWLRQQAIPRNCTGLWKMGAYLCSEYRQACLPGIGMENLDQIVVQEPGQKRGCVQTCLGHQTADPTASAYHPGGCKEDVTMHWLYVPPQLVARSNADLENSGSIVHHETISNPQSYRNASQEQNLVLRRMRRRFQTCADCLVLFTC